jgi:hypothetical protein
MDGSFDAPFSWYIMGGNTNKLCIDMRYGIKLSCCFILIICKSMIGHLQGIHKIMVRFQKLIKKFISHPAWAQHTLSAAGTVQVSHAYCRAVGPVSKMASQQEKAFCVLRFEVSSPVLTVQREFHSGLKKDSL